MSSASLQNRDENVRTAIGRAAARTGVDFTYLLNQAKSESGLDPRARASGSSATGLYQFIDQSWLGVVKQHGAKHGLGWAADAIEQRGGRWTVDPAYREAVFALREQAGPAALMAGEFASDNAEGLSRALGRQPSSTDLYFAHFLGLEGATRFLKAADASPDSPAAAAFPKEARANRTIFYTRTGDARSLAQVYALMARKIGDDGAPAAEPGTLSPTPPEMPAGEPRLAHIEEALGGPTEGEADIGGMLAAMREMGRIDLLRPDPQHAKLAYLMLASAPLA
ncbi:hypothetical protein CLG96_15600 [Sphingomonas oleivorans]|uniref:Flagellar biosynthesis protein FlgJ n=1 Tax=Sphingomonas oleivorans TaxID=1735121 RepID=A0A2T5FUR6_9SPHN|nr:hypothetical protein CLG96_15600 [Sphingomonas oleivorans]